MCRIDRTLAVEPIELVAERQGALEGPLRYGEGFRLRAAGCRDLYLCHGGGVAWRCGGQPKAARFAAHGGELGKALRFGRPLLLRRVCHGLRSHAKPLRFSPPPSEADSDSEDERLEALQEEATRPSDELNGLLI